MIILPMSPVLQARSSEGIRRIQDRCIWGELWWGNWACHCEADWNLQETKSAGWVCNKRVWKLWLGWACWYWKGKPSKLFCAVHFYGKFDQIWDKQQVYLSIKPNLQEQAYSWRDIWVVAHYFWWIEEYIIFH